MGFPYDIVFGRNIAVGGASISFFIFGGLPNRDTLYSIRDVFQEIVSLVQSKAGLNLQPQLRESFGDILKI